MNYLAFGIWLANEALLMQKTGGTSIKIKYKNHYKNQV